MYGVEKFPTGWFRSSNAPVRTQIQNTVNVRLGNVRTGATQLSFNAIVVALCMTHTTELLCLLWFNRNSTSTQIAVQSSSCRECLHCSNSTQVLAVQSSSCRECLHWSNSTQVLAVQSSSCRVCLHWSNSTEVLAVQSSSCRECLHWSNSTQVLAVQSSSCRECLHCSNSTEVLAVQSSSCRECLHWSNLSSCRSVEQLESLSTGSHSVTSIAGCFSTSCDFICFSMKDDPELSLNSFK
jgi:uncharacterized CHY-type Zn-finger protein